MDYNNFELQQLLKIIHELSTQSLRDAKTMIEFEFEKWDRAPDKQPEPTA